MATNNKYDRQLRLWGASGQKALQETTVLLLRATAAGTETLKNLVLPGVGNIMVVDDVATVSHYEAQSNFFLTAESATKSRAQVALELLMELNPDVHGQYKHVPDGLMTVNYQELFASTPNFIVVASDLEPPLLMQVSTACTTANIPLVVVHSYGLMGLVRLQTPPMALLDPKPDNEAPDLRLVTSFPAFKEYANKIDLESLPDDQHGHVPYPVLLYKLAQAQDALPATFAEKQTFRDVVKNAARKWDLQVNFHEALAHAYLAYTERSVDESHLQDLLSKPHVSPKFKALLEGLLVFQKKNQGRVPLQGTIPDMTASTQWYVELQKIYHEQALQDLKEMRSLVGNTELITDDDLQVFCKNVDKVDLFTTRTLQQEYSEPTPDSVKEDLLGATWDPYEAPEHTPLLWYLALRAAHVFYATANRWPSTPDDVSATQTCIVQVCQSTGLDQSELIQTTLLESGNERFAKEICRFANAEIHNIASVVGGVASQEAVKLITGQYVPIQHTYVYNGIASVGGVYEF